MEEVSLEHPAVADAAVFAVAHPTLGEDIAAAVVLREGVAATALELRRFAATKLAAFKVPRRIEFLDTIPRSSTGKAQRSLLANGFGSRHPACPAENFLGRRLAGPRQLGETGRRDLRCLGRSLMHRESQCLHERCPQSRGKSFPAARGPGRISDPALVLTQKP